MSASASASATTGSTPFFALMGDVGSGKSTLCEKFTGKTGLSSNSSTSFTRDSKVFPVENRYWIADTPGLNSSIGRVEHALNLLGALRFKPVTCLLMVCSLKDRLDGLEKAVSDLVVPFVEEFGSNIAVIVTKKDTATNVTVAEVIEKVQVLGLERVVVTGRDTTKAELMEFIQTLEGIPPIDVTMAPSQLVSYFNLAPNDLKTRAVYNRYVTHYKNLAESGTQHMNTLRGGLKRDFAFSFRAIMYDLIPTYQARFFEELKGTEVSLLWSGEMKKEFKRQLLEVRTKCKEELYLNHDSQFRRCPHCGNVWVLAEGCDGWTTCGAMTFSTKDWRPLNVFEWDMSKLLKPSGAVFDWSCATTTQSHQFTDAQIERFLSDQGTSPKTASVMRLLRNLVTQTDQAYVNQQLAKVDPVMINELNMFLLTSYFGVPREIMERDPLGVSRLITQADPETTWHEVSSLAKCFDCTLQVFFGRQTQGSNPELTKPCGKRIAWKEMAPVPPPPDWTAEWECIERAIKEVQDTATDVNLHNHLNNKVTPEVTVAVDQPVADAFQALRTMTKWNQSDSCVVKVRDTVRGKFFFPLPEGGARATTLRTLLESNASFSNSKVESVVKRSRGWNGLTDDEIRIVSLYTTDLFYQNLNSVLHHRKPAATDLDITAYLLQSLNKCPTHPGKVYRGIQNFQAAADPATTQYLHGKHVIWVSFASCSRKVETAQFFSKGKDTPRTLFEIDQVSGVDITPVSVIAGEEETLLMPNTVFQVVGVEHEGQLDKVHLREVPRGPDLLCMMECAESPDWPGDDTPWATSLAFLPASSVKGSP
ncbi:hypothetical protein Pelo_12939 [Pelomyxa schiedti]|nr:hypothetical protein Pelo_12939 [Pelomyxa schiedti]